MRVAGHLHHLPGGQLRVDALGKLGALFAQLGNFLGDIEVIIAAHQLQLFDFAFEFGDGLFKFQIIQIHSRLFRLSVVVRSINADGKAPKIRETVKIVDL